MNFNHITSQGEAPRTVRAMVCGAVRHPVLELVVELEVEGHQRVRQAVFHGMQ